MTDLPTWMTAPYSYLRDRHHWIVMRLNGVYSSEPVLTPSGRVRRWRSEYSAMEFCHERNARARARFTGDEKP
jgi:hypothetical protein